MLIKEINIINFGKLSNIKINLSESLNCFCEENGYGKTTLGAFIKVMFYGFDAEGGKVEKRERTKYFPWQAGVYGGSIVFEVNNKEYLLKRTFLSKASEDSFSLRDNRTKNEVNDFKKDSIGKEIFKIDAASFERTMFLSQNIYDFSSFNDIDAKIGNLVDNTDDMNNYEKAKEKLEKKIKEISKSNRPYGKIENNNNRINELNEIVRCKGNYEEKLNEYISILYESKKRISEYEKELANLDVKEALLSKRKNIQTSIRELTLIEEDIKENKNNCAELLNGFNNVEPNINDFSRCDEIIINLNSIDDKIMARKLNKFENEQYEKIKDIYQNIASNQGDISKIYALLDEFNEAKNKIKILEPTAKEKALYDAYKELFSDGFDNEENSQIINLITNEKNALMMQLNNCLISNEEKHKYDYYQTKFEDIDIDNINNLIDRLENKKNEKKNVFGWLTILLTMACFVIGMLFKQYQLISFIIGGICFFCTIVSVFLNKRKSSNNDLKEGKKIIALFGYFDDNILYNLKNIIAQYEEYQKMIIRIKENQEKANEYRYSLNEIEHNVNAYLKRFKIENDFISSLFELANKYKNYLEIKQKMISKELQDAYITYSNISKEIASFFLTFKLVNVLEDDYLSCLRKVELNIALFKKGVDSEKDIKELTIRKENFVKEIINLLEKYGKKDVVDYKASVESLKENNTIYQNNLYRGKALIEKKECLLKEHPNLQEEYEKMLKEPMAESIEDIIKRRKEYKEKIDKEEEEKKKVEDSIDELNGWLNEINDDEGEIAALLRENKLLTQKLKIIKKALEVLEKAKDDLNLQYANPIETALKGYFDELACTNDFMVDISINRELIITALGAERKLASLSNGYKDIVEICFRMALIEAMYQNEKPLIILDDPFSNLDAKHLENCMNFLKKIAEKYQILYLTCHESRLPKCFDC